MAGAQWACYFVLCNPKSLGTAGSLGWQKPRITDQSPAQLFGNQSICQHCPAELEGGRSAQSQGLSVWVMVGLSVVPNQMYISFHSFISENCSSMSYSPVMRSFTDRSISYPLCTGVPCNVQRIVSWHFFRPCRHPDDHHGFVVRRSQSVGQLQYLFNSRFGTCCFSNLTNIMRLSRQFSSVVPRRIISLTTSAIS